MRAKLQVVSDFRHTRGEILSLLVKDEEKQMTRLLHLFKPLFAWEHPFLKSCHKFNLPRSKLLLGATLNTVVTFSNPIVTTLIARLKFIRSFKTLFDCGSFFVEFSCGDAIESHLLRLGLIPAEATLKR